MDIIRFISDPPKTPFAPSWNWVMGEDQLFEPYPNYFKNLCDIVLSKKDKIIADTKLTYEKQNQDVFNDTFDGYTGLGPNSLTSRSNLFNVLSWEEKECQILNELIHEKYVKFLNILEIKRQCVYINCWANVLSSDEYIKPHLHSVGPLTYLGGHISLTENDTHTVYINPINVLNDPVEHKSKNKVGKITFFQNNIPHYTTKNMSNKPRITLAFDISVKESYDNWNELKQKSARLFDE